MILLCTFLVISFAWYKKYMICLISFSKFSDVLLAFTFARAIGNLWSICLEVNIFNPFPCIAFFGNILFSKAFTLHLHKEHMHFHKYFLSWSRSTVKFCCIFYNIALIHLSFIYSNFTNINIITKRSYCFKMLKVICIFLIILYFKSFHSICSSHVLVSFNSFLISLFLIFFGKSPSIDYSPEFLLVLWLLMFWFASIVSITFLNLLPSGKKINCKKSYLSLFPGDNADIFEASLLVSYCSFSSLILLSFAMINFYILSKIFFLKRKELSEARVVSVTKKVYDFAVHFL